MPTLVDLIRRRADEHPDAILYTFLTDGEQQEVHLTYGALARSCMAIAARLQSEGVGSRPVLLPCPVGLEYITAFLGCLMAGAVAVPAYPPKRNRADVRLQRIAADTGASLALTTADLDAERERWIEHSPDLETLRWISADGLGGDASAWHPPAIGPESVAFLQYSSGSTGDPKGAMVTHANLMANLEAIRLKFGHSSALVGVLWLPPYHDMGLIGALLQPLYVGGRSVLLTPTAFVQRPLRWLRAISRFGGTTAGGPNFAYDLCVRRVSLDDRAELDLRSWDVAFTGAEPCRRGTMEAFADGFAVCGFRRQAFYPCYGLAEATLIVSGGQRLAPPVFESFSGRALEQHAVVRVEPDAPAARSLVGCGSVIADHRLLIVDPETRVPCPPGRVGEIWVGGPSVAQGYWNRAAETEATFRAYLASGSDGPFLRTGDLGFIERGELFLTGRIKDLIKVRGHSHHPPDIELTAERASPILLPASAAAFSVDVDGEERVVVACEIDRARYRAADPAEVTLAVRAAIAALHEIDLHELVLLRPGALPRTSSGKIQRFAARAAYLDHSLTAVDRDAPAPATVASGGAPALVSPLEFSLFYFSADAESEAKYRLYLDGARFADRRGFSAVWTPERHFHAFGGVYPSPSVLSAALAMVTERIRLRAGSVVLPLHDPVRVAEEWAVVDNLSGGRVDLAFARGWNANDFVLAPSRFADNTDILFADVDRVRRLWRGDALSLPNGKGEPTDVRIHPRPLQADLQTWITCSGGKERFIQAGACGANVLTALLFQTVEELAEKLALYRRARAAAGHSRGHVTLMLHTFIGQDLDEVRERVRGPFIEYLRTSVDLWRHGSKPLTDLTPDERDGLLAFAFERYFHTAGLFGTPLSVRPLVDGLRGAGVDEIACLIDFGVEADAVLAGLESLDELRRTVDGARDRVAVPPAPAPGRTSPAASVPSRRPLPASVADVAPFDAELARFAQQTIVTALAAALQRRPEDIPLDDNFYGMGIDSLKGMEVVAVVGRALGLALSPTMLFDAPTVTRLARRLSATHAHEVRCAASRGAQMSGRADDIAVIGFGCRMPMAPDPDAFWRLMRDGHDAVVEVPPERWDWRAWFDERPGVDGKTYSRWGGFLDAIDGFDSLFFKISAREARVMDPQQRLFLEVAWETLEHAGYAPDRLAGQEVGVFVGCSNNGYYQRIAGALSASDHTAGIGNQNAIIANRVSFALGLRGPSVLVDTMCSSSLVAVHLACESLRRAECSQALAGGVNLLLQPEYFVAMSRMKAHSVDGRCRTFDHRANGVVLGEGVGAVLLKPLGRAIADGDAIHAVIRGSAVNHGGDANGLSAPNPVAQEQLIRRAQAAAAVGADEISYVEAHGTGTSLGDPIEIDALTRAFRATTDRTQFCTIGSVKTNVGHLEAAAGIAGLLKVILALQHRALPPNLHFERPNPLIAFEASPFAVSQALRPWDAPYPRRAAVSSFGMGGTNAHVIVEEAPPKAVASAGGRPLSLLTLSAKTPDALRALAARHVDALDRLGEAAGSLGDYCFTGNVGRGHFTYRAAVVGATATEIRSGLTEVAGAVVRAPAGVHVGHAAVRGTPKIAFLFGGQGLACSSVAGGLYATQPIFRHAIDRCGRILGGQLGAPLVDLFGDAVALSRTAVLQPALFALEWSLAELWRSWGIEPHAVMGHSLGEYVAACVAGVFDLEAGLLLAADRGRLMQDLPSGGAMAALLTDEASVRRAVDAEGEPRVSMAAVNAPRNVVISGDVDAVGRVCRAVERDGTRSVPLDVAHAFHSARVEPMLDRLEARAASVAHRRPHVPLVVNLDGRVCDAAPTPSYWRDHARRTVRFGDGMHTLAAMGCDAFVEIGPTGTLSSFARQIVPHALGVASLRSGRDAWRTLLDGVAALYVAGVAIDWERFEQEGAVRSRVPIPTYPFQRERQWLEGGTGGAGPRHPLLGFERGATAPEAARVWEQTLDETLAAGGIDCLLAAARETLAEEAFALTDLEIGPPPASDGRLLQTIATPFGSGSCDVAIWSRAAGAGDAMAWTRHARARADAHRAREPLTGRTSRPQLSIMFFAGAEEPTGDKYRLVLSGARFADRHGFSSVWVPERHFVAFGGLYPNPSVLHAALARETRRVQLRAGSVVLPLHDPLRVAEDWAIVDGLSGGRVGISFASGWNPDDFALAPGGYAKRQDRLFADIDLVRRLWRGETVERVGGEGTPLRLRTYPSPVQRELPVWVSAAGNPRTFERAGEIGANLLTHLLDQEIDDVFDKIALYRAARARAGHDPQRATVTMMLHTFVGEDVDEVRERVRGPFTEYLKTLTPLMRGLARSRNRDVDVSALPAEEVDMFAEFLFERFFSTRALFGTPEGCADLVRRLHASGVDEIACLLDFGPSTDAMLETLPHLEKLRQVCQAPAVIHTVPAPPRVEPIAALQAGGASLVAVTLDRQIGAAVWQQGVQLLADAIGLAPALTGLEAITLTSSAPTQGWLHAVPDGPAGGHIRILDALGSPIAEARGVRLPPRRLAGAASLDDLVYELRWEPRDAVQRPAPTPPSCGAGGWVVIGPGADVGGPLVTLLRAFGACVAVGANDLAAQLGPALQMVAPCRGIVHLVALDAAPDVTAATLARDPLAAVHALLQIVQSLTLLDAPPRTWVITRGAQPIAEPIPLALAQSALWGVGRTCALEHAELWGGLIDLDPAASPEQCATDVLSALSDPDAGAQLGYRAGRAFVALPVRSQALAGASAGGGARAGAARGSGVVRSDRAYLVTGGLWGVGLEVARWLVTRGARHLILVGRSRMPPRSDWDRRQTARIASQIAAIRDLEARDVSVHYPAFDVADLDAFTAFLAAWRRETGVPIGGVVHAASVWQGPDGATLVRPLVTLDSRAVQEVFRPKILGGWLLHSLLEEEPLDLFVTFSSAASLFGSAGQGNYAGAGAFLDALAHHRRASGRPALSVNWGPISDVGFGATEEGLKVHEYWTSRGIGRITPAQVVAALERLIADDLVQMGVMNMNWSLLRESYPQLAKTAWIGALAGEAQTAGGVHPIRRAIEQAPPAERRARLERHMHEQVSLVLGMRPEVVSVEQPLANLGFDSLMAIEMRNRIVAELGVMLPIARFLEGPSVSELAGYVLAQLGRRPEDAEAAAVTGAHWEEGTL